MYGIVFEIANNKLSVGVPDIIQHVPYKVYSFNSVVDMVVVRGFRQVIYILKHTDTCFYSTRRIPHY